MVSAKETTDDKNMVTVPLQKGKVVYTASKVDKNKIIVFFLSIAFRAMIIYFVNKIKETEGAGWQRTLVFAYTFTQFAVLIYYDREDKIKKEKDITEPVNLNTVKWWKAWHHFLLLGAVGFVNFENDWYLAFLGGDLLISVILFTYFRVIKVTRFLRRQRYLSNI